jgi:hypothetical protein
MATKKQGWHEPKDTSGKAPMHVQAATQLRFDEILTQPMQRAEDESKSFDQHLITMIRKAVEQDPHRLSHGNTATNAFWIDGEKIYPYNKLNLSANDKRTGLISVHSHSGENWKDYNEKTDELQPLNGGDLAGLTHIVKYGYGDTLALISAYGELEYIRFTKDSDRSFLSLSPKQLMKKTEVPYNAVEEFVKKGMGTQYDLWRKLLKSLCDYYNLEYHTGLRWR